VIRDRPSYIGILAIIFRDLQAPEAGTPVGARQPSFFVVATRQVGRFVRPAALCFGMARTMGGTTVFAAPAGLLRGFVVSQEAQF
jgi:hypothetical protein